MFNWNNYIKIAEIILVGGGIDAKGFKSAFYRTAVSRAYYGAFCNARNYLRDCKNLKVPNVNVHKWVRDELSNSPSREEKIAAEKLKALFKKRNDADYEDKTIIEESTVRYCITLAKDIVELLHKRLEF